MLSRRAALALGLGAGVYAPAWDRRAIARSAGEGLGAQGLGAQGIGVEGLAAIGRSSGLSFGASTSHHIFDDPAYRALFLAQASVLAPEHALKFDALQPEQGRFVFAPADSLVDFARGHGLLVRGHTLFWNDYPPPWLKTLTRAETAIAFDRHLETVVPHFAGRLFAWDVVNEPFWLGRDKPGTFRPGPWYDALGEDYIFRAFRRVAALDPSAKLVLNEAWTERSDPVGLAVRRALLRLIDRMLDKGLKLDAIGLQGHLSPQDPYDDTSFTEFLHDIASRGLDIHITEFDVDDRSFPASVPERDRLVAARTRAFLAAALQQPAIKMLVCWELSDRYSWRREPATLQAYGATRLPRPLPFDDRLQAKPMRAAIADVFRERKA